MRALATTVRMMTPEDFPFAVALTDTERWGFTTADFERCLAVEPKGCFVVELDGERAGLLTTIVYGAVAWLGNVIVSQRLRGKGLGAALLVHALKWLDSRGAQVVRLWAYTNTLELYKKYGFKNDELTSSRWIGFGHAKHSTPPPTPPKGCRIFPVNALTIGDVNEFDERYFGANRARVISRIVKETPRGAFVARTADSRVAGYLVATASPKGCEVGPWVVAPGEAAWAMPALIESILHGLEGESLEMGVLDGRKDVQDLLESHGFHAGFQTHRMTRAKEGAPPLGGEDLSGICAIGSLERG